MKTPINLRTTALVLLLGILLMSPMVRTSGQTAGPTAPEYTSFEPIDVTDMVSLVSGNFTYVLPIMEVPGPEGGYPIALSYHAGQKPHEEASWVGLGWTLNAGAISRTVSGFPDDFGGTTRYVWDYWDGGETDVWNIGVGFGGVHVGLDFSQDTYQGFGVGGSFGAGMKFGDHVGAGATVGVSPRGDPYASLGVSTSVGSSASAGMQLSTDFESVSVSGNMKINMSVLTMGTSISSEGLKPGVSAAGVSISQANANAGKITAFTTGWGVSIPVIFIPGLTVDVGHSYTRYWSGEGDYLSAYGTLFADEVQNFSDDTLNTAFDSYAVFDLDDEEGAAADPEAGMGGSLPAYDRYTVMGQGVGGTIQPYILENGYLKRQDVDNADSKTTYLESNDPFTKAVYFRFNNDFSNTFLWDEVELQFLSADQGAALYANSYQRDVPEEFNDVDGFDSTTHRLAGSKHVDWYTNQEIYKGDAYNAGLIAHDKPGQTGRLQFSYASYKHLDDPNATNNIGSQIGGFKITNESGVTYHYTLPVYNYQEYTKTYFKDKAERYRETKNYHPYAYTWLLTAITGPDYVDDWYPGGTGTYGPSEHDYGYWVNFEYGKWSDQYRWRNPGHKDYEKDIDGDFKTYSKGKKQIYYLNSIRTRSHTALFVKKFRADGKGASGQGEDLTYAINDYDHEGTTFTMYPTSLLALDEILLFKNSELDPLADYKQIASMSNDYNFSLNIDEDSNLEPFHYGINVIDEKDVDSLQNVGDNQATLYDKALRAVTFNTDYSLCQGVINSFEKDGDMYQTGSSAYDKLGKLTLTSVQFHGKGKQDNLPPVIFSYDTAISPNPPFVTEGEDIWGNYKSDYDQYADVTNDNIRGMVTAESAENVHAWNLTSIETTLGAKIHVNYESDDYYKPALYGLENVPIQSAEIVGSNVKLVTKPFPRALDQNISTSGETTKLTTLLEYMEHDTAGNFIGFDPRSFAYQVEPVSLTQLANEQWEIVVYSTTLTDDLTIEECAECDTIRSVNFLAGELQFEEVNEIKGGGIRVTDLSLETDNYTRTTHYTYEYADGISSGFTSYEPYKLSANLEFSYEGFSTRERKAEKAYKRNAYTGFTNVLAYNRFIPAPGVLYNEVMVSESIKRGAEVSQIPGYNLYTFDVFDYTSDFIRHAPMENNEGQIDGVPAKSRTITMYDYTNRAGNLLQVEVYGANGELLKRTHNKYLYEMPGTYEDNLDSDFDNQGLITQVFHEFREVERTDDDKHEYQFMVTRKQEYPSVQIEQVDSNFVKNTSSTTKNIAFDFYTGKPSKVVTTDPYGVRLMSETKAAYLFYPEMGPKVVDNNNKNMLTQTAYKASYTLNNDSTDVSESAITGVLEAEVGVWDSILKTHHVSGKQVDVWNKRKSYRFTGDETVGLTPHGAYPYSEFDGAMFTNWYTGEPASDWEKQNELLITNNYSKALQVKDMNGNYASALYGPRDKQIIASVKNARYAEVGFNSFDYAEPLPNVINYSRNENGYTHTGSHGYRIGSTGSDVMLFTLPADEVEADKKYKASVWMYLANDAETEANRPKARLLAYRDGQTEAADTAYPEVTKKAGSWYLVETVITPQTEADINVGVQNTAGDFIVIDDFRFLPLEATMTSYVYDHNTGELTHILDANNIFTEFEYDAFGRLKRTYQERIGKITKIRVNEQYMRYAREEE